MEPRSAVFDCMVFLQAVSRPKGPAGQIFIEFVAPGILTPVVCPAVLDEVRDVLGRPEVRRKNLELTDVRVDEFLGYVSRVSRSFPNPPTIQALPRDPDDEPYLNLALTENADYLVTWDNDMLDLVRQIGFRVLYPHLCILTPVQLLRVLRAEPEGEA